MDHAVVQAVEKALAWSGPARLGVDFAQGRLADTGLCSRLLTPTRLLDLLARRALGRPQVRCLQQGAELHPSAYLTTTTTRRGQAISMVDLERLGELLRDGCTLVVDAVNTLDPVLEVACRALQWWSGELVQVNAYLTTGQAAGFALHFDDHDVIIVQVAGAKTWEIRGPSRRFPLYRDTELSRDPSEDVLFAGALSCGDVISMPRGFWHQATRDGEGSAGFSLHLTFGFPQRTGIDWLTELADHAREQELFRRDLADTANAAELAAAAAALAQQHSPAEFVAARRARQRPTRRVVTGGAFGPPASVVCVSEFAPHITSDAHQVVVAACGKRLRFAAKAQPALSLLLSGTPGFGRRGVGVDRGRRGRVGGSAGGGGVVRGDDRRIVLGLHRTRLSRALLAAASELGITQLDTAVNYDGHTAHARLAAAGRGLLDGFTISTKVGFVPAPDGGANRHTLDPRRLTQAVRRGADELGRTPDMVLLHNPERSLIGLPPEAAWHRLAAACQALTEATREQWCAGWGISAWDAGALAPILDHAPLPARPQAVMVRAGLLVTDAGLAAGQALGDRFRLPNSARFGMSPFGGDTSRDIWRSVDPRLFLAPGHTASRLQAALRVAFDLPGCGLLAVGASSAAHLREAVDAADLRVDGDQLAGYRTLLSNLSAAASAGTRNAPA